jgi:hypothetical protein
MILSASLMSCSVFQARPEPCACGKTEQQLREYTDRYLDALEDVGNLRQQLKACHER